MNVLQLFAVTKSGVSRLSAPNEESEFEKIYDQLSLGIYSALRTFSHNKFLCLDAHLARSKSSMLWLGWDFQLDEAELRHALHEVCTAYPLPNARVRYDVLAEPAYQLGTDSRVLIALKPFTPLAPEIYQKGVSLGFAPGLSRNRPLAKTADFAVRRRDYVADHPRPAVYEYLMLDESGSILEGTGSNFYGVLDGVVYTAGENVLEGITRKIIHNLLQDLGIPLRLKAIQADQVSELEEAAISSSSRALLPVVEIEGKMIGDGHPGPVSQRILAAYNEHVARVVKTAVSDGD